MAHLLVYLIEPIDVVVNDDGDTQTADCIICNRRRAYFGQVIGTLSHAVDKTQSSDDYGDVEYLENNGEYIPVPQGRCTILDTFCLPLPPRGEPRESLYHAIH